jgi:hypothetical protein
VFALQIQSPDTTPGLQGESSNEYGCSEIQRGAVKDFLEVVVANHYGSAMVDIGIRN